MARIAERAAGASSPEAVRVTWLLQEQPKLKSDRRLRTSAMASSLDIVKSDLKPWAAWTSLAAARACRPKRFLMTAGEEIMLSERGKVSSLFIGGGFLWPPWAAIYALLLKIG
jgi:hypothetical protein